ncbi:MAG: hypothetical protein K2Q12_00895 [Rickettsiales bacterium]|nr:hypothetical protein [Rickettsiales bacterium]
MPIFTRNLQGQEVPAQANDAALPKSADDPSLKETFGASFVMGTSLGAPLVKAEQSGATEDYDPFGDIAGYEQYSDAFIDAGNKAEVDAKKRQIDTEIELKDIIDRSGAWGTAVDLGVQMLAEPLNAIPGLRLAKTYKWGDNVLQGAVEVGTAGLVGTAAQEVVLQGSLETRSTAESVINIAGATLLSGVLGGTLGALSPYAAKQADELMRLPAEGAPDTMVPGSLRIAPNGGDSVGAARATTLEEEALAGAFGVEKVAEMMRLSPAISTATSPALPTRQISQRLAESVFYYEKNANGVATPVAVERRARMHQTLQHQAQQQSDALYGSYVKRVRAEGQKPMKRLEFNEAVSFSMRRDDVHHVPEVQQTAKAMRENLFDPLKNEAVAVGLLPEGVKVKTAASYLTRIYDRNKIIAKRDEFSKRVIDWLVQEEPRRGEIIDKMTTRQTDNLQREIDDLRINGLRDNEASSNGPLLQDLPEGVTMQSIMDAIEEVKAAERAPKAQRLAGFVRSKGGIADSWDEINNLAGDSKKALGLKSSKGKRIDEMALAATEAGYFKDRPTVAEFLSALSEDVNDVRRVVRSEDNFLDQRRYNAGLLERDLFEMGIDVNTKDIRLRKVGEDVAKPLREKLAALREAKIETRVKTIEGQIQDMQAEATRLKTVTESIDDKTFIADEIIDRILGTSDGRITYDAFPLSRGPLKERVFDIPDHLIEDFLENDIDRVASAYIRTMAPDVEIKREFGSLDLKDEIQQIKDEYNKLISQAKNEAERISLNKRKERDINDVSSMLAILRGQYGRPDNPDGILVRAGRAARNVNFVSKLGGMTISAFSDVGRVVMTSGGTLRILSDGLLPLARNFQNYKLSKKEAQLAGTALEGVANSRAEILGDVMNNYRGGTKFERGLQGAADSFGNITLMNQWNTALKSFSGLMAQARIAKASQAWAGGRITPKDKRYMAMLGVDQGTATRIAAQFKKYGKKQDGAWIANTEAWDDSAARISYRAALSKEIDRTIITPGIADRPWWMGKEWGGVIGQFKSFAFASTNRMLISGLQEADLAFVSGLMVSIGFGTLSYMVKQAAAGNPISDDPKMLISEGVDRSGILSIFGEMNGLIEQATRGSVGLSRLAGATPLSRYASRGVVGQLLGPTFGTATDLIQATGSLATADWTAADTQALRRILPYQNLFYTRSLLDAAERGINDTLGVKQKKRNE